MHQNSPTAIAGLKNFPGDKLPDPRFSGGRYAAGGGGEGTGWEVGRGEGRRERGGGREGGRGWRPPL